MNWPLEIQLPTCQHLVVCLPTMGHLPVGEHLPHQHAESPDVRLGGEVTLQDGLGRHPAQGHPGLAEVVVLTAGQKDTEAGGWGEVHGLGPQPQHKSLVSHPGWNPSFLFQGILGNWKHFCLARGGGIHKPDEI